MVDITSKNKTLFKNKQHFFFLSESSLGIRRAPQKEILILLV